MKSSTGITGSLLPGGYLAGGFQDDARELCAGAPDAGVSRTVRHIWTRAVDQCGPATGSRALFDLLAEPLFIALGFSIKRLSFSAHACHAVLETPARTPVILHLLPWASRASVCWRDLARHAGEAGARWGFVLAPPFLSLVRSSGTASRHALDFSLPLVVDPSGFDTFWTLVRPAAFDQAGPTGPTFLENVVARAERFQDQVREDLQHGVSDALAALSAVLAVPRGRAARRSSTARATASLSARNEALTLVYRVLFLLFAESRSAVPLDNPVYARGYSIGTLCRDALAGSATGSWEALAAMTRLARLGCRSASLLATPFNGRLFARTSAPALEARPRGPRRAHRRHRDAALAEALVALASRRGQAGREAISYRDLGVEQLGAVYERVLDYASPVESLPPRSPNGGRPSIPGAYAGIHSPTDAERQAAEPAATDTAARSGRRSRRHSEIRKHTGTFYTPQSLADFIVRRTLAPLVDGASADRILSLRVLDPAMGSGACLVSACQYLAAAYERALVDEGRSGEDDFDHDTRADLRRLVAERCLVGVDRNPTAVEVARLSLWLTTLARGKPLGFLDHHLRVGDSLIGAWPEDLGQLTSAGPKSAPALPLFDASGLEYAVQRLAAPLTDLLNRRDDTVRDVHAKEAIWRQITSPSSPLEPWRRASALWCARWFWPGPPADRPNHKEARAVIDALLRHDRTLPQPRLEGRLDTANAVARDRSFFHWPLEFPDVFYDVEGRPRPAAGFDAVLGNPPWEMLRRDSGHEDRDPQVLLRYLRESGQYPSCDRGHLNLYQAFLDRTMALTRPGGRFGLVLPWSLASDDGAARLRSRLLETCALDTLVGLDNARGLFPIHRGIRFVVVAATAGRRTDQVRCRFGVTTAAELDAMPGRAAENPNAYPLRLTPETIRQVGGPLLRFPDARREGDVSWLASLTRGFPRLGDRRGWGVSFGRELNATEVRPRIGQFGLPVVDGKHLSPFSVVPDDTRRLEPRTAAQLLPLAPFDHPRLAYRDVSGVANTLTLIAAIVPAGVVTTHTLFCLKSKMSLERQHFLCALFNSYVLNAVVRMLMGGHVTTTLVEALPAPEWRGDRLDRRIAAGARHLSGKCCSPAEVAASLQAAVAHRFGLTPAEFRRVLEGFPLVRKETRELAWAAFEDKRVDEGLLEAED